jgi:hypothetical protein
MLLRKDISSSLRCSPIDCIGDLVKNSLKDRSYLMAEIEPRSDHCPDNGACHHGCADNNCFRVGSCSPLSGVFPNDEWPQDVAFDAEKHIDHLESLDKQPS